MNSFCAFFGGGGITKLNFFGGMGAFLCILVSFLNVQGTKWE